MGDFNIAPAQIDYPEVDLNFYRESRPDRLWMRMLLSGSSFVDAFRVFHPRRLNAFTVWNTSTNARANNYGSRIDLVLTAGCAYGAGSSGGGAVSEGAEGAAAVGPARVWQEAATGRASGYEGVGTLIGVAQPPAGEVQGSIESSSGPIDSSRISPAPGVFVVACDIQPEVQGSDHCPIWTELRPMWDGFTCAATAPACAARHAFTGKQTKLHRWLTPSVTAGDVSPQEQEQTQLEAEEATNIGPERVMGCNEGWKHQDNEDCQAVWANASGNQSAGGGMACGSFESRGPGGCMTGVSGTATKAAGTSKQRSLKSFFQQQSRPPCATTAVKTASALAAGEVMASAAATAAAGRKDGMRAGGGLFLANAAPADTLDIAAATGAGVSAECSTEKRSISISAFVAEELAAAAASKREQRAEAQEAWKRIQQRMAVPVCKHREAAVLKRVNKSGPNHGG